MGRTDSEMQAKESHRLLSAIEHEGVAEVRLQLEAKRDMADAALTSPSLVEEHGFRTPLMAAVMRGDLPIFTALLRRFERRFSKEVRAGCTSVVCPADCSNALCMVQVLLARQVLFGHDPTAFSER